MSVCQIYVEHAWAGMGDQMCWQEHMHFRFWVCVGLYFLSSARGAAGLLVILKKRGKGSVHIILERSDFTRFQAG